MQKQRFPDSAEGVKMHYFHQKWNILNIKSIVSNLMLGYNFHFNLIEMKLTVNTL